MKIQVEVTSKHIEEGQQTESHACAMALALREVFPKAQVGVEAVELMGAMAETTVFLPAKASEFIKVFDRCPSNVERALYCSPIKFEIEVPEKVIDAIQLPGIEGLINRSKHLVLVS